MMQKPLDQLHPSIPRPRKRVGNCKVVDLFAGAGGLSHGFFLEGFQVVLGIDTDPACEYPFTRNNPGAEFLPRSVETLHADDVLPYYSGDDVQVLVGCAPCQPFSSYTRKKGKHESWALLYEFARLIQEIQPDIVSMENVPRLKTYDKGKVFEDFVKVLKDLDYDVNHDIVYAPDYGVPQHRHRLILIASKWGKVEFLRPSHGPGRLPYRTVRETIGHLPPIRAGEEHPHDPLHRSMGLAEINLRRIRASKPGGTWLDWPEELRAACHRKSTGRTYKNVYGRMVWDEPSPTITTQFYGFGNGRFGHPEQDRGLSLREGALLQTFPSYYEFVPPGENVPMTKIARWIGNAVPVALGRMIAKSIRLHILQHRGWLWTHAEEMSGYSNSHIAMVER